MNVLRSFRQLERRPPAVADASAMTLPEIVRIVSRALVSVSAYDSAIVRYCRNYFDEAGNEDLKFRHDVARQLRGPTAFAFLWVVYLDSSQFRSAYQAESGQTAPSLIDAGTDHSPTAFAELIAEMKASQTELETKAGNNLGALKQQARLTARRAKEVGLVDYAYVSPVKTIVSGTDKLHEFFSEWFLEELDYC